MRTGIPITTLHNVFRDYSRRLSEPLGDNSREALRAATFLCAEMCESFDGEEQRSIQFNKCTENLFSGWKRHTTVNPANESTYAQIDYTLQHHRQKISLYPLLIREDKIEHGEAGDAYIQTARDYQLFIHSLQEDPSTEGKNLLKIGAPMFLLSVIGMLCLPR